MSFCVPRLSITTGDTEGEDEAGSDTGNSTGQLTNPGGEDHTDGNGTEEPADENKGYNPEIQYDSQYEIDTESVAETAETFQTEDGSFSVLRPPTPPGGNRPTEKDRNGKQTRKGDATDASSEGEVKGSTVLGKRKADEETGGRKKPKLRK